MLVTFQSEIIGFNFLKELYEKDEDLAEIWEKCSTRQLTKDFHILDGFFLKRSRLCVPMTSLREKVFRDLQGDGLDGHFGRDKLLLASKRHTIGRNWRRMWLQL